MIDWVVPMMVVPTFQLYPRLTEPPSGSTAEPVQLRVLFVVTPALGVMFASCVKEGAVSSTMIEILSVSLAP